MPCTPFHSRIRQNIYSTGTSYAISHTSSVKIDNHPAKTYVHRMDTAQPNTKARPAIFFDRDGVLNVDKDYAYKPSDLIWIDGAIDAIRWCNTHGYWAFVVTNQSGIARGYYSEAQMQAFHQHMQQALQALHAHIDAFAHCPHHPQGSVPAYTMDCACRKPKAGLLHQLLAAWPVDTAHSLLIGDKQRDLDAAHAAGIRAALYTGGNLCQFLEGALSHRG